jgi:hypothetical protein
MGFKIILNPIIFVSDIELHLIMRDMLPILL